MFLLFNETPKIGQGNITNRGVIPGFFFKMSFAAES